MKAYFNYIAIFLLVLTLFSATTLAEGYPCNGTIIQSAVNVRKQASASSDKVGQLKKGTVVTVVNAETSKDSTTWYQIEYSNLTGYVRGDLIEVDFAVAQESTIPTPVTTEVPATPSPTPTSTPASTPQIIETPQPSPSEIPTVSSDSESHSNANALENSSHSEPSAGTSMWERRAFLDEFNMPTNNYYISNSTPIKGTFSNSATTNSDLSVYLYIEPNNADVSIRLIEYGSSVVKNPYSKNKPYEVTVMDTVGERHYLSGTLYSGGDSIRFDEDKSGEIISILSKSGTVRFAITDSNSPSTKYVFSFENGAGFGDFIPYTSIDRFCEGLARVKKAGKYGFVNTSGQLVVPCEWDLVGNFSEGLATVRNNATGYVNAIGELVIPCIWGSAEDFHEGLARVSKNGKYGYINTSGEIVIQCEWDDAAYSFNSGLAYVKKDDKYGFINTSGDLVIPCEWDAASSFHEGLANVKKDEQYGFINTTGKLVIPCKWDDASSFYEGLARVKKDKQYGFINTSGKLVIPCELSSVQSFQEGFARVWNGSKCGYINTSGKLVVPFEWKSTEHFCEGLASVKDDSKYGFIDTTGKLIIPCEWNKVHDFHEGFSLVLGSDGVGLIDISGNVVIPCEYDSGSCGDGYFIFLKNGTLTIFDKNLIKVN